SGARRAATPGPSERSRAAGFRTPSGFRSRSGSSGRISPGRLPADHPYARVRLQPEVLTVPEIWLLGSSDYSGALAAQLGMAFAFAHFINPHGGDEVMQAYREHFRPGHEPSPRTMVCTFAICGEDDADAERLAQPIDLRRLHMALNVDAPVPTP